MALGTMIKQLADARARYEDTLREVGKDARNVVVAHLSEHLPPGVALAWAQYTPYFNDGEPCKFGVNDPFLYRPEELSEDKRDRLLRSEDDVENSLTFYESTCAGYGVEGQVTLNKGSRYERLVPGIPAWPGFSREQYLALRAAWAELPKDLLERAFGDHVRVRILGGAATVGEHDHD